MIWIALHLPLLPLEAFCASLPGGLQSERPVALLHEHRVAQVNAAAAARGLRAGLQRATAMALSAELLLAERDPAREAAALQAVVHAALAFTPAVVVHDAQTVLLEVQPSLRLFGGLAALHAKLRAALAPLGHRLQAAAAPTPAGAALLARWQPRRQGLDLVTGPHATALPPLHALLDAAPVSLLEAGAPHAAALRGMGIHTLAALRALPREGLTRRVGEALLDELDRARGDRPDPRQPVQPPARFEAALELAFRADHTDQVLHAAGVLLARLVAWAQARHARVRAFTLWMRHERARQQQAEPSQLRLELAEPALDLAHLQALLRERLARFTLPAPTLDVALHCHELVAAPAPNGELFPTRAAEVQGLARLLERLRARLGESQVQRLVPVADHRPERASRALPLDAPLPLGACAVPVAEPPPPWSPHPPVPLHRPAWLLGEPVPLAEREGLPLWQGRPLQLLSGPERIETGWWDEAPVARDYFIAEAVDGALVWVFRQRRAPAPGEPAWHLQGLFA